MTQTLGHLSPIEMNTRRQEANLISTEFAEFGVHSSLVAKLPYFNPVRLYVTGPMLLGTAKHMIVIWTKLGIVTKESFKH